MIYAKIAHCVDRFAENVIKDFVSSAVPYLAPKKDARLDIALAYTMRLIRHTLVIYVEFLLRLQATLPMMTSSAISVFA